MKLLTVNEEISESKQVNLDDKKEHFFLKFDLECIFFFRQRQTKQIFFSQTKANRGSHTQANCFHSLQSFIVG